jgi:hypothetical protein
MLQEFPVSFVQEVNPLVESADGSSRRMADAILGSIQSDSSYEDIRVQGIGDDLRKLFKVCLTETHEFLCTSSEKYRAYRSGFAVSSNAAILACAHVVTANFPGLQNAQPQVALCFKLAYEVGVQVFCRYASSVR